MFQLSEKVKLSDFYLSNYPGVCHLKDKAGEIISIDLKYIKAEDLMESKEGYTRFLAKYGKLEKYECFTLKVKYPDQNLVYIMSQFGVDPIDE